MADEPVERSCFLLAGEAITRVVTDEAGIERPIERDSQLATEIAACPDDVSRHFLSQLSQHCTMLTVAIFDALASLDRLDPSLPFSAVVLARGLFEAAADLYWLSDHSIDAVERTRRTFLIFLRQHETQVRRIVQLSNRVEAPPADLSDLDQAIAAGWASLKLTADSMASAGYKLRVNPRRDTKYSVGEPKPSISALVDTIISELLGKTALNLYSTSSTVAHVEGEGLASLLLMSDSIETAEGTRYRHGFDAEMWEQRIAKPTVIAGTGAVGRWVNLTYPSYSAAYNDEVHHLW